jgi:hypothetical protein
LVIGPLRRFLLGLGEGQPPSYGLQPRSLPFSWVLTNHLAIGPMPRGESHWRQLEEAGFRSRFSCCYPEEEEGIILPVGWRSDRVSLPDHREQEEMQAERLALAIRQAQVLLSEAPPVYLHCMAGRERSPLVAVGLTARVRGIDMLGALAWVRRCHPIAMPIYPHLVLLDALLADERPARASNGQTPQIVRGEGAIDGDPFP